MEEVRGKSIKSHVKIPRKSASIELENPKPDFDVPV